MTSILIFAALCGLTLGAWVMLRPWLQQWGLKRLAEERSLTLEQSPANELPQRFDDAILGLRSATLPYVLHGEIERTPVRFVQHEYTVMVKNAMRRITHRACIIDVPTKSIAAIRIDPRSWHYRGSMLSRALKWLRRAMGFGTVNQSGLLLESSAFNRRFHVTTEAVDNAIIVLEPAVQEFVLSERAAAWRIHPDAVVVLERGPLTALNAIRLYESVQHLLRHIENDTHAGHDDVPDMNGNGVDHRPLPSAV